MKKSLLIASDIHRNDGVSNLKEVLGLVKSDSRAVQPETVLLGGDYAGGGGRPPASLESPEGRAVWVPVYETREFEEEVRSVLGEETRVFMTYGSHDKNAIGKFFTGPAGCGGFYVYGISFVQMKFACRQQLEIPDPRRGLYDGPDVNDEFGSCASEAAENFLKWADSLEDDKPVFVMSHIPMHLHRHDNLGASIWCDCLNEAGKKRPIYFFFCHNHTAERSSALDRQYYLVLPGQTLPVQGPEAEDSIEKELNFTYLNGGYVIKGCATLVTMDWEGEQLKEVEIKRYALESAERGFGDTGLPMPYVVR